VLTVSETELSPDRLALKLPSAKQRARLGPAHLNDADLSVVTDTLIQFKANLDHVLALKPSVTPSISSQTSDADLNALTQATVTLLKTSMSPEGFQHLQDHVIAEKRNMKIVPIPQMNMK
jgi:hypothetical protein